MEKWKRRSVDLLTSIAFGGSGDMSVVPFCVQKSEIGGYEKSCFSYASAEKYGISSGRIYNMLCELEGERRANVHSIMVLCGGEIISECSVGGYDTRMWHVSHSMAKTVVGIIIGSLVDDGLISLDMRLVDIFPEIKYRDKLFPLINIEHLLTMTSGVEFAEVGSITEIGWIDAYFNSLVRFVPGSRFAYNSMNSYILVRIVERICSQSFEVLAERRFFAPMGIRSFLWEKSPEGYEKGGWGLYMSPQSWAKVGLMMLSRGVYCGRRIVSEKWVDTSVTTKAITPESNGGFNYGYHIWTARDSKDFLFNGMLGQNVWVCPDNDLVVVMTGGNSEIFQESAALEIVRKYLGGKIKDTHIRNARGLLRYKERHFFESRSWVHQKRKNNRLLYRIGVFSSFFANNAWENLCGCYAFGENRVGIMPLTLRIMQNNLLSRLEMICFSLRGEDLIMEYLESGEKYKLRIGLYDYVDNLLICRGEKYIVRAMAEAVGHNMGDFEYRIELVFAETSSVRRLKIKKTTRGRVEIAFSETPSHHLVENLVDNFSKTNSIISFAVDLIERKFGEGVVKRKIQSGFNPVLVGADVSFGDYQSIIEEQTRIMNEESRSVRLLMAFVSRFFKERNEDSGEYKNEI